MTEQEAIKTIKYARAEVEWNYPLDYTIAFDMAIKSLENQIKIKQILSNSSLDEDDCVMKINAIIRGE